MLALVLRTLEFVFYHLLITFVDNLSRQPRGRTMPEAMRLYRQNIALKAQLDALERRLFLAEGKPKRVPMRVRAAQVFAYLLTRGDEPFHRYSLTAGRATIVKWATRFRSLRRHLNPGGRPQLDEAVVELIVTLKRENPGWGQRRIRDELRRMGIRVSEPTVGRILRELGFSPRGGRKLSLERVTAAAKDALWAIDFFAVKTAKGAWLQTLIVVDIYTREILDMRVHDGWDVDSSWTSTAFGDVIARTKRKPLAVVHDHGSHFRGQFERSLGVLEIGREVTPVRIPEMNCFVERSIWSVRRELLAHIPVRYAEDTQFYLDEYRQYATKERAHQGLCGRTPDEVSRGAAKPEIIDLAAVRARRLERRGYAHGLLHGYSFVGQDEKRAAA